MYFHHFVIISLWKGRGPSFEQIWIPFTQGCFVPSLVEIGPVVFRNYLPLEKGGAFHFNKLESPSPNDALCPVWLKLAVWSWRNIFLNLVYVSSLFRNYLPLKKGGALLLHPKMLCASGSEEEDENVKSLQTDRQTDGRTDRQTTEDRWSEKLTWAFSSGEVKKFCYNFAFAIIIWYFW